MLQRLAELRDEALLELEVVGELREEVVRLRIELRVVE